MPRLVLVLSNIYQDSSDSRDPLSIRVRRIGFGLDEFGSSSFELFKRLAQFLGLSQNVSLFMPVDFLVNQIPNLITII